MFCCHAGDVAIVETRLRHIGILGVTKWTFGFFTSLLSFYQANSALSDIILFHILVVSYIYVHGVRNGHLNWQHLCFLPTKQIFALILGLTILTQKFDFVAFAHYFYLQDIVAHDSL